MRASSYPSGYPGKSRDPLHRFVVELVHCVRPRRVFGPAAALLSCIDKKGGKEATPADSALAERGLPCAARSLRPRRTRFVRCAHCAQTGGAKSVLEARYRARRKALCCSARPKGKTNTRLASLRFGPRARLRLRAEAKRGVDGMLAKQATYCSWGPSEPSSSAGLCSRARSAPRGLTSRGCLSAAATGRVASSARAAKTEQRRAVAPRATGEGGRLSFGSFSLAKQRKGTAPPGAHPGAASRSENRNDKQHEWIPTSVGMTARETERSA